MALVRLNHPSNNQDLPSFVHPVLADVAEDLEIVLDCWNGLKGAKEKYLPKEVREPKRAYEARLMRTCFNSFFRDAINAFTGVLSRYQLVNPPASLLAAANNIDGAGNSLRSFLAKADAWTLRDGGCLLMADMPPAPGDDATLADTRERRPHYSLIDRRNLLNWIPDDSGAPGLAKALTVLEMHEVPVGLYGVEFKPRYRTMVDGGWAVFELVGQGTNWQAQLVTRPDGNPMAGVFRDANGDEMARPPVRWYPANGEGFGQGDPPLLPLARYALDHFREYSDLKELLHRTALPVAVRTGMPPGPDGKPPPMVLGPNSALDLPAGASFAWAEVQGGALSAHRDHLIHIENLIDRKTLAFLFSGAQKTATQANLESVQMQATLQGIGEAKTSVVQSMMELWTEFSGETLAADAGIELDEGIFDEPMTAEKLAIAERLYNNDLLSRRTLLYLEKKVGFLPPGQTIEQEQEAINNEEPEPPPAPSVGVNDLENA
jgi:hypothetical protein